jgi:hypothetical protein
MTLRIELTPEEESWLRARALERGQDAETVVREMLRSLLPHGVSTGAELLPVLDEQGVFHRDRWEAVLASIKRRSRGTPVLPAEALTREALYQDHD